MKGDSQAHANISKTEERTTLRARGLTQLSMSNTMIKMTQHKAYTSVQFEEETAGPEGRGGHFELNSELVYINHSCEPNVAFELPGRWSGLAEGKWRLRSLCDIKKGDVRRLSPTSYCCILTYMIHMSEGFAGPRFRLL